MNSKISLFLCLLLCLMACAPEQHGWPAISNGTDAGDVDTGPRIQPSEAGVSPTDNAYLCTCRIQVPLNCINGCGTITTGTSTTTDQFCDFGYRNAIVCLPTLSHPPTNADLEADCSGRVQTAIREGLRVGYNSCTAEAPRLGACDIRFGCSALHEDGTAFTVSRSYCDGACPSVALVSTPGAAGGYNFGRATYVPASLQTHCSTPRADTVPACGQLL